jgi:hypothetical protein
METDGIMAYLFINKVVSRLPFLHAILAGSSDSLRMILGQEWLLIGVPAPDSFQSGWDSTHTPRTRTQVTSLDGMEASYCVATFSN